jgi:hypothetical protein
LTSALDEVEWSASRPGRLTPDEGSCGTPWIGREKSNETEIFVLRKVKLRIKMETCKADEKIKETRK